MKTQKPILSSVSNNMGTIITVRSPLSRQWLFNLSLSKGFTMSKLSALVLTLSALVFYACEINPTAPNESEPVKPHYHYIYTADTLTHANNLDYSEYTPSIEWTSVSVYMYADTSHWTIGTATHDKPVVSSSKPVYWNGTALVIDWDKLPTQWDKVIIRFSRKEQVK